MEQTLIPLVLAALVWTALLLARSLEAGWKAAPPPRRLSVVSRNSVAAFVRDARIVPLVLLIGWIGGMLCGFPIVLFGDYLGRSGTTGTDYLGYWNPESAWFLARTYGSLVGALVLPAAYIHLLSGVPLTRWPQLVAPAAVGTIAGGSVGALVGPPLAVLFGCFGFWLSCRWAIRRLPQAV